SFGYAGRNYVAGTPDVTTQGIFAHGWAPTHENDANPVSTSYYNSYNVTVAQPNIAGYHANQWRITDNTFFGSAGGLAQGTTIDYAGVNEVATLVDNKKTLYGYKLIVPPPPSTRGPGLITVEHTLGNGDDTPLYEFGFELPLQHPESQGWLSSTSI